MLKSIMYPNAVCLQNRTLRLQLTSPGELGATIECALLWTHPEQKQSFVKLRGIQLSAWHTQSEFLPCIASLVACRECVVE